MAYNSEAQKKAALTELAAKICTHKDWWLFPAQEPVKGFMGTAPLFIVGDQPSMSEWLPSHPNRLAFYGHLQKVGASNAHLTDIYKKRGKCSELRKGLPRDFSIHLEILRQEIEILQPERIVALGHLAYQLMVQHFGNQRHILRRMWHFSYAVRAGKLFEYEVNIQQAIGKDA